MEAIRGGKKPLLVEVTSNIDEEAGEEVPIPTCAWILFAAHSNVRMSIVCFIFIV